MEAISTFWAVLDAQIHGFVINGLERIGFDAATALDPTNEGKLLINSAGPICAAICGYLAIVFIGLAYHSGKPSDAANKPKKDAAFLRVVMVLHNIFLIVLSAGMAAGASIEAYKGGYRFWGQDYTPKETRMASVIYVFFLSKLYEFVDTFIMLAKGNTSQVSLLHVYHHVSISFVWWLIARSAPGGDAWYSVMLNSTVHVVMYTYYLIAMFKDNFSLGTQKFISNVFGRSVTRFQMAQFCSMILQSLYCYAFSPYPLFISRLYFYYILSLLALFAHFYRKKFLASKSKSRADKAGAAVNGQSNGNGSHGGKTKQT